MAEHQFMAQPGSNVCVCGELESHEVHGCALCRQYAKTGGPSHNPSPFCESGKRPHCTCDRCW